MNPASLMMGVAGLALQIGGGIESYRAAGKLHESQMRQVALEREAQDARRKYMEMDANRKKIENFRKTQQMQALSLNNATTQGAQFSSSKEGGQAQIRSQGLWNETGINQSLMTGRKMFDLADQQSNEKVLSLFAQRDMQEAQAISNLGSSLIGGMGQMGQLTGGSMSSAGTSIWDSYSGGFMQSGSFNKGNA